jgi:acetyl-CoA C-acetyltransferase/acetyl-CoA acyltransferase
MKVFRKRIFAAAGYNTTYFGPGRKEFDPAKPMPSFDTYLKETAEGTCKQLDPQGLDEGFLGSFMAGRFLKQANLPGFIPFMVPELYGKPCTGIEGACGTGGRAISMAIRSVLSESAEAVFVAGFEIQNGVKSLYGADILAGAAYYKKERKNGHAFFFPGIFSDRAGAYYQKVGKEMTRRALAKWYELAILNARKNPKAQEYQNKSKNLLELGMTEPNAALFLPHLNLYDCSKVSDGASSLVILSEEGLKRCGIQRSDAVEIIGLGEAEGNITEPPPDSAFLTHTSMAAKKALEQAKIGIKDLAILEVHDCFTISGLLSIEALGLAKQGEGPGWILEGNTAKEGILPTNLSGGLCGFGHPTGASGVRQLVDLIHQMTGKAENQADLKSPYGMLCSMGGNDITVTSIVVKQ